MTVSFRSTFPAGNGRAFEKIGEDHFTFEVELYGGELGLWFYFCAEGAADRTLTFDLRGADHLLEWPQFFGAVRPVYGRPGAWRRVREPAVVVADHNALRFAVRCEQDPTYVAFCYPYVMKDLDRFRGPLLLHSQVREKIIAHSSQKHPVHVWEIGKGRSGVWVTCRHHAGESPASLVLEGLVAAALSPSQRDVLTAATMRVCPMVDVDNVESGAYGKFGPPCDPWQDWGPQPQLPQIRALQEYFAAVDDRPCLYIDLHCPEPCGSTYAATWNQSMGADWLYCDRVDAFCAALHEASNDPLKVDLSRCHAYPQWYLNISNHSQGYFKDRFGCVSLTLETSYHWSSGGDYPDEESYRTFGEALCRAVRTMVEAAG